MNFCKYYPYFKKLNAEANKIERLEKEYRNASTMDLDIVFGVTTYVNSLYTLFKYMITIKKSDDEELTNQEKTNRIKKLFKIKTIIDVAMLTVFIIALILMVIFYFYQMISYNWIIWGFSVIVFVFLINMGLGILSRASIREWLNVYQVLIIWGEIIESDSKDYSSYNTGEE